MPHKTGNQVVARIPNQLCWRIELDDNSVLHHRRAPPSGNADASLILTREIFLAMMTGTADIRDTLLSDELEIGGSRIALIRFFALLDQAPGNFAIVTP